MTEDARKGETIAAQAGHFIDAASGALTPPWQPSVTFARDADYAPLNPVYAYGRDDNPTTAAAESVLAALEGAEAALLFASGLAAAGAVFETLGPGARIVAPRIMYWGTLARLAQLAESKGITLALFDASRAGALEAAVGAAETALIWIETPCNPTWEVIDIAAAAAIARHFEHHEKLQAVLYPGLPAHSGYAIAARQMEGGFGGMFSVLAAGGREAALGAMARTEIFIRATSLGGVESLVEHRATVEGPNSNVPGNLLRFSVGTEDIAELIGDVEHMLAGVP